MATKAKKQPLIRTPESWARDWGWVSRLRAVRTANRLNQIAEAIRGAGPDDEGHEWWAAELEEVAKYLAPEKVPAERKHERIAKAEAARA